MSLTNRLPVRLRGCFLKKMAIALLAAAVLLGADFPGAVDAQSKHRPCSLLQVAELEAALGREVDDGLETDVPFTDGAYRGETLSQCMWLWEGGAGTDFVLLKIIQAPQTAQQRTAWRGILTGMDAVARGMGTGWAVESGRVGDAECVAARAPATATSARSVAGCALERKGLALWLELGGNPAVFKVTLQQVGALLDKTASRLP